MSHDEHRTIDFFAEDALPAPRVTPPTPSASLLSTLSSTHTHKRWEASRTPTSCCATEAGRTWPF